MTASIEITVGPENTDVDWDSPIHSLRDYQSRLIIKIGSRVKLEYVGNAFEDLEALRISFEKFLNDKPDNYDLSYYSDIGFNPRRLKWSEVTFNLSYLTPGLRELMEQILAEKRSRSNWASTTLLNEPAKQLLSDNPL